MSERTGFLQMIAAEPDCDTHRLVFADFLDEQPKERKCQECRGTGWARPDSEYCDECMGAGTITDTSASDLAEFIRLGVEIAIPTRKHTQAMYSRLAQLEAAHPEWRKCECRQCEGGRRIASDKPFRYTENCPTCGGTGDLFDTAPVVQGEPYRNGFPQRPITFSRGFVQSVECRLEELGQEQVVGRLDMEEPLFVPSPWAIAVITQTPMTEFRMPELQPADRREVNGMWYWFETGRNALGNWSDNSHIPRWLFDELESSDPDTIGLPFPTAEAAHLALAQAAGRVIRKSVYSKQETRT